VMSDRLVAGGAGVGHVIVFNPLQTKRTPLYLKIQFVPHSKHFISVIKINQFMV
jgi:hypothetical protein